jgi:hypothetical protein
VEELEKQPLAWEEELTRREEALTMREEKARISEMALVKISDDLDAKKAKTKDARKECLNKMQVHMACTKHTLGLDKMLGEKKVQLDGKEWDLDLHEAVLVEVQSRGLKTQDNREELMELVKL